MKITAKLTTAQRRTIDEHLAEMDKLTAKHDALLKTHEDWSEKLAAVVAEIATLETKADEGDEEAIARLFIKKDQRLRLRNSIARKEAEIDGLVTPTNEAIAGALAVIKDLCRPLLPIHREAITDALAPFCSHRHHADQRATECESFGELQFFVGPTKKAPIFNSVDEAAGVFNAYRARLASILEGGPFFEFAGCDVTA